jgi:enoyl-CoA hydratase
MPVAGTFSARPAPWSSPAAKPIVAKNPGIGFRGRTQGMAFKDILYEVDGPLAVITLNRPAYRNAQSYRMLDEIDAAFTLAQQDDAVRVLIVRGSGGAFSTGHDLGTPDALEYREALGAKVGIETYDQFKKYNLDLLLRWRNFPKPTIAMVEGYCIYAGWMLAACCDLVFAADSAEFLAGVVEYMSIPWDIGVRRAKELCFESRFITAAKAHDYGFVNHVLAPADLERETYAYARRVAENSPTVLRFAKIQMNKAQDAQGYSQALEDSLGDYVAMMYLPGSDLRMEGERRVNAVDLAVRGRRGERAGLTPIGAVVTEND